MFICQVYQTLQVNSPPPKRCRMRKDGCDIFPWTCWYLHSVYFSSWGAYERFEKSTIVSCGHRFVVQADLTHGAHAAVCFEQTLAGVWRKYAQPILSTAHDVVLLSSKGLSCSNSSRAPIFAGGIGCAGTLHLACHDHPLRFNLSSPAMRLAPTNNRK